VDKNYSMKLSQYVNIIQIFVEYSLNFMKI